MVSPSKQGTKQKELYSQPVMDSKLISASAPLFIYGNISLSIREIVELLPWLPISLFAFLLIPTEGFFIWVKIGAPFVVMALGWSFVKTAVNGYNGTEWTLGLFFRWLRRSRWKTIPDIYTGAFVSGMQFIKEELKAEPDLPAEVDNSEEDLVQMGTAYTSEILPFSSIDANGIVSLKHKKGWVAGLELAGFPYDELDGTAASTVWQRVTAMASRLDVTALQFTATQSRAKPGLALQTMRKRINDPDVRRNPNLYNMVLEQNNELEKKIRAGLITSHGYTLSLRVDAKKTASRVGGLGSFRQRSFRELQAQSSLVPTAVVATLTDKLAEVQSVLKSVGIDSQPLTKKGYASLLNQRFQAKFDREILKGLSIEEESSVLTYRVDNHEVMRERVFFASTFQESTYLGLMHYLFSNPLLDFTVSVNIEPLTYEAGRKRISNYLGIMEAVRTQNQDGQSKNDFSRNRKIGALKQAQQDQSLSIKGGSLADFSITVSVRATTEDKLDADTQSMALVMRMLGLSPYVATFWQTQAMISTLPFAYDSLRWNKLIARRISHCTQLWAPMSLLPNSITTVNMKQGVPLAITTQRELITINRGEPTGEMSSFHGIIIASPGWGKTKFAEWEGLLGVIWYPDRHFAVFDPQGFGREMCEQVGGNYIDLGDQGGRINLLDRWWRRLLSDQEQTAVILGTYEQKKGSFYRQWNNLWYEYLTLSSVADIASELATFYTMLTEDENSKVKPLLDRAIQDLYLYFTQGYNIEADLETVIKNWDYYKTIIWQDSDQLTGFSTALKYIRQTVLPQFGSLSNEDEAALSTAQASLLLHLQTLPCLAALKPYDLSTLVDDLLVECKAGTIIPILSDLRRFALTLGGQDFIKAINSALTYEHYGKIFNGTTNIDLDGAYICFGVSDAIKQPNLLALRYQSCISLIVKHAQATSQLWTVVFDEAGKLIDMSKSRLGNKGAFGDEVANYMAALYRDGRSKGISCIMLEQTINNLLDHPSGNKILQLCSYIVLGRTEAAAANTIFTTFDLDPGSYSYITTLEPGEGLMKVGNNWVHFFSLEPQVTIRKVSTKVQERIKREQTLLKAKELRKQL